MTDDLKIRLAEAAKLAPLCAEASKRIAELEKEIAGLAGRHAESRADVLAVAVARHRTFAEKALQFIDDGLRSQEDSDDPKYTDFQSAAGVIASILDASTEDSIGKQIVENARLIYGMQAQLNKAEAALLSSAGLNAETLAKMGIAVDYSCDTSFYAGIPRVELRLTAMGHGAEALQALASKLSAQLKHRCLT